MSKKKSSHHKTKNKKNNSLLYLIGLIIIFTILVIVFSPVFKIKNNVLGVNDLNLANAEIDSTQGFKQALVLEANGTGFNFLELGKTKDINPASNFTIEMYIKPKLSLSQYLRISAGDYSWINYTFFDKPGSTSINLNGRVDYPNPTDSKYKTRISFYYTNSSTGCPEYGSSVTKEFTKKQLESWHHIAGVIQSDGKVDIFLDGTKGKRSASTIPCISPDVNKSMYLGADGYFTGTGGTFFGGYVDELRLSNTARYQSDFTPPANPFKNGVKNSALFHFNGNVNDSSANSRDGIINGKVTYTAH